MGHKFLAHALILTEDAKHGAGRHAAVALVDAAHHAAHMRAIHDHSHAARIERAQVPAALLASDQFRTMCPSSAAVLRLLLASSV